MHNMYAEFSITNMHFQQKPGNSDLALTVLANLSLNPLPYISGVFTPYWVEEQDINDIAIIEKILKEADISFKPELLPTNSLNMIVEQAK
jgi:predicted DsbA family dithiol-disulfide isomerase